MNYKKVKPLTEGGVLVAVAVILALIGTYLPFIGVFATFLWPVPIAVLGVRHGYRWSILATVVAALLIAALVHPLQAVTIAVGLGLVGIVFGQAFRAGYSPAKVMILGTLANLFSNTAVVLIGAAITGINPFGDVEQIRAMMNQVLDFYQKLGLQGEQLSALKNSMAAALLLLQTALPALLLITAAITAAVNYWFIRKLLRRFGQQTQAFPPFCLWEVPRIFFWGFTLAVALLWFGNTQGLTLTRDIAVNLLAVSAIALFVQGMALLWFVFNRFGVHKLFRVIIILLIFLNGVLPMLVIMAGVFEQIFEFRKKSRM